MPLNKTKGDMYDFITHTWNPIRGRCLHDCSYCHPVGTQIMMGDFTRKDIKNVKIGDEIIGIKKTDNKGYNKFTRSKVVNTSKRKSKVLKLTTKHGELICTPEHPLMGSTAKRNCTDWKAAKAFSPYENLKYITNNERGCYSDELRFGYLKGVRDGDGCVFKYKNEYGKTYLGFEIVCIDEELSNRIESEFNCLLNIKLRKGIKRSSKNSYGNDSPMLHTRITVNVKKLERLTKFRLNKEFAKGYIAGMIDTDGSVSKQGGIRISQSTIVNKEKYNRLLKCCNILGLGYVEELNMIRLKAPFTIKIDILFNYGIFHSEKSKRLFLGRSVKGSIHSQITSIEALGEMEVYNLQTECENFIADGFVVHNCYMKEQPLVKAWDEESHLVLKELELNLGSGKSIFVGSSTDMWGNWVDRSDIQKVLDVCCYHGNKYLFQTKDPRGYFGWLRDELPGDVTLGCTIESNRPYDYGSGCLISTRKRFEAMRDLKEMGYKTAITIEPIMDLDVGVIQKWVEIIQPEWVAIGADSGGNDLDEPGLETLIYLITGLKGITKVIQKDNLRRLSR